MAWKSLFTLLPLLISLKVLAGQLDEAIELISAHRFDVWEGGTSTAADDWTNAHVLRGRRHLEAGNAEAALLDFRKAAEHPDNLPSEARGSGLRRPEFLYWTAVASDLLGATILLDEIAGTVAAER